jgi:GNAT superfamily N-acetyltransferase
VSIYSLATVRRPGLASPMNLEQFDPAADPESVRACHEIFLAGVPADDPDGPPVPPRSFANWLELHWLGSPSECWLARDGAGEPAGWFRLILPQHENRHLADLALVVHPSRRRAGLGTALLRSAAARARDLGRSALNSATRKSSPGEAFARTAGARAGITEIRRALDVVAVEAGRLASLRESAEAAAAGYSLLDWDGRTPEEYLAGLSDVHAATADIPRDPGHEATRWDPDRLRLADERIASRGLRIHTIAARSLASGQLAGLTQILIDPDAPAWADQALTAVSRAHRGHRIGLLLKVAMLELLARREPQIATITTYNAEDNQHMIAINEELGYTVMDRWSDWEIEAGRVLAAPA